jgi:hypothetical protein
MVTVQELQSLVSTPVVSMLWIQEKLWIVKIDSDWLQMPDMNLTYHPCDERGSWVEDWDVSAQKFCNYDGSAYSIVSF